MSAVGKEDIIRSLRDVGLESDALLMVHSSLSGFGKVIGGADTVIEALLEVVSVGTIVMPSYTDRSLSRDRERDLREYDARTERAITGVVSERFRLRRDVIRQPQDPWHPMAVWGRHQKELIEAPAGSTYRFLMEHGGQTLLIGVGSEVHSFIHWMLDEAPELGAPGTGVGAHSKLFPRLDPWMEKHGAERSLLCGGSRLRLIDLAKARSASHQALREQPDLLQTPSTLAEDAYRINITMPKPLRKADP
jgi:aminoglycoside N3'-acetyltransferase